MPPRERDLEVSKAFGRAARVARARLGFTRREVAQETRIKPETLGRIERGEREPGLSVLWRLAQALRLSPQVLLVETERELRAARARQDAEPGEEG